MFLEDAQDSLPLIRREIRFIEQRLKIAAENGEWPAQFMGNIGNELPPDLLELLQLRDIMKEHHGAAQAAAFLRDRQ